jgi:hypothetical protein
MPKCGKIGRFNAAGLGAATVLELQFSLFFSPVGRLLVVLVLFYNRSPPPTKPPHFLLKDSSIEFNDFNKRHAISLDLHAAQSG